MAVYVEILRNKNWERFIESQVLTNFENRNNNSNDVCVLAE